MTLFKNYFKIIKKHIFHILIYSVIFFAIIIGFTNSNKKDQTSYSSVNVNVYLKNHSDSKIAKALEKYINNNFNIKNIKDSDVDDELFYGLISSSVEIDKNFDQNNKVIFKNAPKSMYGMLVKNSINNYISKYKAYANSGFDHESAVKLLEKDLSSKAKVEISNKANKQDPNYLNFYFNFINYVLMAQIILVVSVVMVAYNKEVISKRNKISPVPSSSQSLQLTLGHIVIGIIFWATYMFVFVIKWPDASNLNSSKLMMVNSFVFTITIVTMAVLISKLVKSENSLSAVMNIVALGSSFLSGAFVSQELLSKTTLDISKILPSYYYIKNNNMIVQNPSFETMFPNLIILIAFATGFSLISIFLDRYKKS